VERVEVKADNFSLKERIMSKIKSAFFFSEEILAGWG
jgi:hypothetical protein